MKNLTTRKNHHAAANKKNVKMNFMQIKNSRRRHRSRLTEKEGKFIVMAPLINSMSHFVIYLLMNYAFCNFHCNIMKNLLLIFFPLQLVSCTCTFLYVCIFSAYMNVHYYWDKLKSMMMILITTIYDTMNCEMKKVSIFFAILITIFSSQQLIRGWSIVQVVIVVVACVTWCVAFMY